MKRLIFILITMIFLVACGADEPQNRADATQEALLEQVLVQAEVSRRENVEVSQEEIRELVDGHNQFAFDLYAAVTQKARDSNLIYSPLSISQAFSMVYAGARGETEAQMAEVFYYLPQERQHAGENWLDQELSGLAEQSHEDIQPFELHIASAVWGQKGFTFQEPYLTTLAEHYGAGLRVVDFAQNPDQTVNLINAWIAQQTEDRIQDLASRSTITPQTVLVLANAIYFNASWYFRFDESATQDGAFTLLDGQQVTVPLMQQEDVRVPYIEGDGYQAIQLAYTPAVSMLIILPSEGQFESIEQRLSTDFFDQIRHRAQRRDVTLTMPRFDFESEVDLAQLLPEMGMPNAFGGAADFSGMAEGADLSIGSALHRATITVDEKGTEASAATLAVVPVSEVEQAEMSINRPFIFAIVERERGTILFLGRVMNPAQADDHTEAGTFEEVDEPELEYAQEYADQMDVDLVEADRRLQLETSVEGLYERLMEQEGDTFGGLWIEHEPEYRIVVLLTRDGEETIRPYIEGGPLADDAADASVRVEVRQAEATYVELLAAQEEVLPLLGKLEPVVSVSLNTPQNRVDLGVTNCAKFYAALEEVNETLPDHVTVLNSTFSSCDETEGSAAAADIEDIEDPLSGTRWQLLAFADEALPEQPEMWVEFKNGGLSLEGGCNSVGGSYELFDEQITMGLSKTTEIDCSKPGANEIERAFFTALRTFESYSISDDELRIRYADGELLLRRLEP